MMIHMRFFQASLLVICGAWAAAEDAAPSPPPLGSFSFGGRPLTEVGAVCDDAIGLPVPTDGSPKVITGTPSKLYSLADCYSYTMGPLPATIYQIEGTGAILDVSFFAGPFVTQNDVAVYEGCPGEPDDDAGDGSDSMGGNTNCVVGQYYQGARWQTKAGQLYTIVVYSLMGPSYSDFILRVGISEAEPICGDNSAVLPIDLGTVNATSGSLQILGGPEDSVLVTDLPQCDYQTQSSSALYKITVGQPDVVVLVSVEGDSYVTVYRGNCENGYSCLAPMNGGNGYPISASQSPMATQSPTVYDNVEGMVNETAYQQGDISMPRYSYNLHSFHNENAGSTYLISVNSCCGSDVSDFRLTVNTTRYGNVCEDSVAVDLSSGEFTAAINPNGGKVYRDLNACYADVYYEDVDGQNQLSSYVSVTGPITNPAVFYEIAGDGNTYVAYTTASDPNSYFGQVRMALLTSASCDETPQCLQGDNYNNKISIETTVGETYYLVVYNEYAEAQGSFDLKISSVSSKTPCEDATDLGTVGSAGRTVNGTTAGADLYKGSNLCDSLSQIQRPRVYSFVAEADGTMMASVKGAIANGAQMFYPQVAVVKSCGDGACIAGLTTFEVDVMVPGAVWNAETGVTYYVVVYTYDLFATGEFQLTLEPMETAQVCESENVVDLGTIPKEGAMFNGSTVSVPFFAVPQSCYPIETYFSAVTRAAAFRLTGDGNAFMFSISNAYSFSPQATVFKGSCDNLECIPTTPYASSFLVDTEPGETYTILIGDCCSAGGSVGGTFQLHAKQILAGNVTTDAVETIESLGNETKKVIGSTRAGAFYPGLPVCQFPFDSPAAAYTLNTGAGFFSAQVSGFGLDAQLSLFQANDAGGLECVGQHSYRSISWEGKEGQSLYLVVFGCCDMNAVGDFALRFSKSLSSGEPCNDVVDLGNVTDDGLMHIGSLEGWSFLSAGNETNATGCAYEGHYASWGGRSKIFTVQGNDKTLVASAFIPQSTMNQGIAISVTVVQGKICGSSSSVQCIEGAHSESLSAGSLTWPSVAGETYDVIVSTCCSESDDEFVFMVYEKGTKTYGYEYPPVW